MTTTAAIRKYIQDHPSEIVDVAFLHRTLFPIVKPHTFFKTLARLRDEGLIKAVDHGVYAPAALPDSEIEGAIFDYYVADTNGALLGDALYYELKIIDFAPETKKAYTNRLENGKKKRVLNLELTGANIVFDDTAKDLVTLLEMIEDHDYAIGLDSAKYAKILEKLGENDYSDALIEEVCKAIPYKSSTLKAAEAVLTRETE